MVSTPIMPRLSHFGNDVPSSASRDGVIESSMVMARLPKIRWSGPQLYATEGVVAG